MNATTELSRAYGEPKGQALFKQSPEDFRVYEHLHYELTGSGEHVFIYVEKKDQNTMWVVQKLSEITGVPKRDIGYAGLKDRQAITRQWLSFKWPINQELPSIESEFFTILETKRHIKKLKRGAFGHNEFIIRLTQTRGICDDKLEQIKQGVPNYFGEQRFGRDSKNVANFLAMVKGEYHPKGKSQKGMLISAARSQLFNLYLSALVEKYWPLQDQYGPLWGRAKEDDGRDYACLSDHSELQRALEAQGLDMEYRPLTLHPQNVQYQREADALTLRFDLPVGCFATVVLRELCELQENHSSQGLSD